MKNRRNEREIWENKCIMPMNLERESGISDVETGRAGDEMRVIEDIKELIIRKEKY